MRGSSTAASQSGQRGTRRTATIGVELCTSAAAFAGGIALVVQPDGSLLQAKMSALHGTPFTDWRVPGLLLATLIGCGLLVAGGGELLRWRHAPRVSVLAGTGLVAFECAELLLIGFQPLEAVVAAIGVVLIVLRQPALRLSTRRPAHARRRRRGRPHPAR